MDTFVISSGFILCVAWSYAEQQHPFRKCVRVGTVVAICLLYDLHLLSSVGEVQ